jgi:c-di-GMP-binding flagellar brake protein YcgR
MQDSTAAKVLRLLNQKIERLASIQSVETRLVSQVAMRVQEVNISACGMAFQHDHALDEGSQITIELELRPSEQTLITEAIVVRCEPLGGESKQYFCRVDFCGMSAVDQEFLIQQIVQAQSAQLKSRRNL